MGASASTWRCCSSSVDCQRRPSTKSTGQVEYAETTRSIVGSGPRLTHLRQFILITDFLLCSYLGRLAARETARGSEPVEIGFPIEFLVKGTPVSLQAKRPESREEWKEWVKAASATVIPQPHFASDGRMSVTLYYLPKEPMQGDVDNIVKPILDALSRQFLSTTGRSSVYSRRSSSPGTSLALPDRARLLRKHWRVRNPFSTCASPMIRSRIWCDDREHRSRCAASPFASA